MKIISKLHRAILLWLLKDKKLAHDEAVDELQRLLMAVLLTSLLMWSYFFNSLFYIDCSILIYTGFICSLIHLLSPLIYKVTGSILISVNTFIGVGFIFQYMHAFHSGGFFSGTTIWFSILPLISGLILGINLLITWSLVAVVSALSLFFLDEYTTNILIGFGKTWAQVNIVFGYIMVNYVLIYLFMNMKQQHRDKLRKKNKSIKKLLLILGHDIAGPLTSVLLRVKILKKTLKKADNNADNDKNIDGIEKASNMIKEIIENTRRLMAIDTGKEQNNFSKVALNDIVESSLFVFKEKLEDKQVTVNYDFEGNKNIFLYTDKVSIKSQVFNNLFSNSIKFMDKGGEIKIAASKLEAYTEINFEDCGRGIEPAVLKNIFSLDIKTTQIGTAGEKGTGFGMPILHATLIDLGATVSVKSHQKRPDSIKHGTKVCMKFFKQIDEPLEVPGSKVP